jgi:hypothetical protein
LVDLDENATLKVAQIAPRYREDITDCLEKHSESLSHECPEAISDRPEVTQTHGQGLREHHRGHRMGNGGSFGRGPYDGAGL